MKDLYYILGLSKSATIKEIREAFYKLSKKFHPDVNFGDKFFEQRFKDILEAYEILSDDEKRKNYDFAYNLKFNSNFNTYYENQNKNENNRSEHAHNSKENVRPENQEIIRASSYKRMFNFLVDISIIYFAYRFFPQINFLIYFCSYYLLFELLFNRTIGKYFTNTKVVSNNGEKASLKAILIRTMVRLIPFEGLSFFGNNPWGVHDILSKTYVIDISKSKY
ncbi:MAG: DnaJ domain-containing protein [Ignavibacteriaceae bacterium]|nr:DnaJ domain-containing protein [Ignavibacteriaceae bacterium]